MPVPEYRAPLLRCETTRKTKAASDPVILIDARKQIRSFFFIASTCLMMADTILSCNSAIKVDEDVKYSFCCHSLLESLLAEFA